MPKYIKSSLYEIVYDYMDEYIDETNLSEIFEGDWHELQEYLKDMRKRGCYNIDVADVTGDFDYDDIYASSSAAIMCRTKCKFPLNDKSIFDYLKEFCHKRVDEIYDRGDYYEVVIDSGYSYNLITVNKATGAIA